MIKNKTVIRRAQICALLEVRPEFRIESGLSYCLHFVVEVITVWINVCELMNTRGLSYGELTNIN